MKSQGKKRSSQGKKRMHTKKRSSHTNKRMHTKKRHSHTKKRSQSKKYRGGFGSLSEGEIISKIDKNIQRFQDLKNKNKTKNACLNEQVLNTLIYKMNGLKCGESAEQESVYGNVVNVDKFQVPYKDENMYGNLGQPSESVYAMPFFEKSYTDKSPTVIRTTKPQKEEIVYQSLQDTGLNQEAANEDESLYAKSTKPRTTRTTKPITTRTTRTKINQ